MLQIRNFHFFLTTDGVLYVKVDLDSVFNCVEWSVIKKEKRKGVVCFVSF